ncbi:MAG TPA: sigma-70 family RNA polymerase sigma factor [Puia sp.]|uniref:RNA polymerase sigma factor n=1 Tax=Puia sp. TaxID=2045100 RepID=UPI002C692473|nr:sigma-70 family RNA polymerase sigma factor [Puia sp.]HVU95471.1 sigma-70 family RNA polymerase sigma factor [Puia sp.]
MQAPKPGQPVRGNEEAIIISFREGNKEAFRMVYDQMVRPLTYFVENIIHSQTDSEDIVANAFYKLFHARAGMKSFEHIKRWLYVIVRNEAIDFLRLKNRQRESQHDLSYLETGIEEHVETERVRTILLQDIHKEIEKLPRQRKTILRLYFFEQKNTSEIAQIMQLSPQTVLNHKTKALDALRKSGLKVKWLMEGVPGFAIAIAAAFYLLK